MSNLILPKDIGQGRPSRVRKKIYKYLLIPKVIGGKVQHYTHNIYNKVGVIRHRKGEIATRHLRNKQDILNNKDVIKKEYLDGSNSIIIRF